MSSKFNSQGKVPMIIETQKAVQVNEGEDLAATLLGGIWSDFKLCIPEPQAKILTEGFNLIILSQPEQTQEESLADPEAFAAHSDSLVPNTITNVLLDENSHVAEKKNLVFSIITGNIIETLVNMGFTLHEDEMTQEVLPQLCKIVSVFFDLQQFEDVMGLANLLESTDIPPKDRWLGVMERYLGVNFDLNDYELLIDDVSEVTLKALRDGLMQDEEIESPPQQIITRVIKNREKLDGTLAYKHVRANGQVGGSIQSFLSFFSRDLDELTDNQTDDNMFQYGKEVVALFLVSEINNESLKDRIMRFLSTVVDGLVPMNRIEVLINGLVLSDE